MRDFNVIINEGTSMLSLSYQRDCKTPQDAVKKVLSHYYIYSKYKIHNFDSIYPLNAIVTEWNKDHTQQLGQYRFTMEPN